MKQPVSVKRLLCVVLAGAGCLTAIDTAHAFAAQGVEVKTLTVAQAGPEQWHQVFFEQEFSETPVVIMGPASFAGINPLTVRLRKVTADGFEFQLDEWDYLDGRHAPETLSYLAAVPGVHHWDGVQVTAGKIDQLDHQWQSVSFANGFSGTPVVLAQQVSDNGGQATTARLRQVNAGGFDIRLQEQENNDQRRSGQHAPESVNFVAIATGTGSINGYQFRAGLTAPDVNHQWQPVNFGAAFTEPHFFAGLQTYNGADTATLRYKDLASGNVSLMAQEEQSADRETRHAGEAAGWLVLDSDSAKVTLAVDNDAIEEGQSVSLSWQVQEPHWGVLESVIITPDLGAVAPAGEQWVSPTQSTHYELEAQYRHSDGHSVSLTESVHVDVEAADQAEQPQPEVENVLPRKRVRLGRFTVGFRGNDERRGARMARAAAAFYNRNSRGRLQVHYTGAGRGNYVFKVDTSRGRNNVGGLSSYQHDVAIHEMGHKLGLGHSKRLSRVKKGRFKGRLAQDTSTVMNGRAQGAPFLVAPQYYLKGWMPDDEVALFDGNQAVFDLKRISDFDGDGLSTVVITAAMWNKNKPGVGAPVFISFAHDKNPKARQFAMHLLQGAGTRLIAQKGESFRDTKRTGIGIEMLPSPDPDKIRIRVSLGHKEYD